MAGKEPDGLLYLIDTFACLAVEVKCPGQAGMEPG